MIDLGWPGHAIRLARLADDLGYRRYWATSHHHRFQSASPVLVAGLAGMATRPDGIRVGTAGIPLRYHAPMAAASDGRMLELQFPGRVDLGVAGARLDGALHEAIADGRPARARDDYATRVEDLLGYLDDRVPTPCGVEPADLGPGDAIPTVWICTTSASGAELAGRLGLSCAFHHHLTLGRPDSWRTEVVDAYRSSFRPSGRRQAPVQPEIVVAAYGMCVHDDAGLARWLEVGGHAAEAHSFLGTPTACRDQLDALSELYGVDELVVHSLGRRLPTRVRAYSLLANVMQLTPRDEPRSQPHRPQASADLDRPGVLRDGLHP